MFKFELGPKDIHARIGLNRLRSNILQFDLGAIFSNICEFFVNPIRIIVLDRSGLFFGIGPFGIIVLLANSNPEF